MYLKFYRIVKKETVSHGLHREACHLDGALVGKEIRVVSFDEQAPRVVIKVGEHAGILSFAVKDAVVVIGLP